jgi:hydroxyacylglutathione hydrolase
MKILKTKSRYSIYCVLTGRSNAFLISGGGKNILIDTGPGGAWKKLTGRLKNLNIKAIDFLILTHGHYDHAENSAKIRREYGAKVIINAEEAKYLEKGENIIPHGTNIFTRLLIKNLPPALTRRLNYEPCFPDVLTDQYSDFIDTGLDIHIIHTPGHSPGSQSIIVDNEIALVGDAIFGVFPRSVFPPFAEDEKEMIKSWGKLLETGCSLFLPSHGTEVRRELLYRDFMKRDRE